MPTTKNAMLRYQVLDECFKDPHHKYTIDALIDKVSDVLYDYDGSSVSLRQIREDIKYMRDRLTFHAPIATYPYDGKKQYYRYSRPFSIFNKALSRQELTNLHATIEMLGRYRGTPANAWLEEVISSLEYHFGVRPNAEKLIAFEQNERLKGLEHLSDLIDATVNHLPLLLTYETYAREEFHFTIHPYYMKQYNTRWYLFAFNEENYRVESYALDRIKKFSRADVPFRHNGTIDFASHFDDVVGVSVPYGETAAERIVLRFSDWRLPYVLSKPLHRSQELCAEPNTIAITVKPTRELTQQLFSFGPDVEVVAPEWLRQEMKEKLAESLRHYS